MKKVTKGQKKSTKKMTLMQRKAFKYMMANGGTWADALRAVGYSESIARNPQKVTESQAFKDALDEVGLSDRYIAKGYKEFTKAGELREHTFPHIRKKHLIHLNEDDPKYNKKDPLKNIREEWDLIPVSTQKIKATIEKISGAELIDIQDHNDKRVAFYQRPDFTARKTGYELASKAKGHLAQDTNPFGEIKHTLSEEDRDIMKGLFGSKK